MFRSFLNPISLFTCDLWCSQRKRFLSPLRFLIYKNDLPNISSFLDTYLFADYTKCLYTCDDGEKSKLNNELNKWFEWIKNNELSLNNSKTQVLQSHEKNDLTLELDGELLFKQPLVKYLGIKIDERFNFTSHIQDIIKKTFSADFHCVMFATRCQS